MSSINRVLRNTINSHIIQDHKYNDQDETHPLYPNEGSDGSEDDESRAIYHQQSWQPPIQIKGPTQKDIAERNVDALGIGTSFIQSSDQNYHRQNLNDNKPDYSNIEYR